MRTLEVIADVNGFLGTCYISSSIFNSTLSEEIVAIYLKRLGNRVTAFGPSDAARIWAGGPHGHLDRSTIDYWNRVGAYFKSQKKTSELKHLAEVAG